MKKTDFSRHSIADLRDWQQANKLEVQPDFQRGAVWNLPARIMLIDSILKDVPLPKIFIASAIKDGNTHRIVIDGQQRITSILMFLDNKFILESPYSGDFDGMFFKDLPEEVRNKILSYRLDFNEFENFSEQEIREIYNRVNKYTIALNKQELRRADFPGEFLKLSEDLAVLDYFDDAKIFTPANRRRLGDVEYISEILAIIIDGPQDKKETLDKFYVTYTEWEDEKREECQSQFLSVIADIQAIFAEDEFPIKKTRFRQKSDFYSLFAAIYSLQKEGHSIHNNLIEYLREDLEMIHHNVEPGNGGIFGEYAARCLSDANSKSSREWRINFLKNFLISAYDVTEASKDRVKFFVKIFDDLGAGSQCEAFHTCPVCHVDISEFSDDAVWCFPKGEIFASRALFVHKTCLKNPESKNWVYVDEQ